MHSNLLKKDYIDKTILFSNGDKPAPPYTSTTYSPNDQKESLWLQILDNPKNTGGLKDESHVLALGFPDSGKSSLIRILQRYGVNDSINETELYLNTDGVSGIDNAYINVRRLDEEEDLSTADIEAQMNFWILQSPIYKNYLKKLFNPKHLKNTIILIFLDLSNPWNLISHLTEWLEVADEIIEDLISQLSLDEQDYLKIKLQDYISNYKKLVLHDSNNSIYTSSIEEKVPSVNQHDDSTSSTQNILHNNGIPIIAVICKSDSYATLNSNNSINMMDVVIAYIRKICLVRGAAIIFTSSINEKSTNTLLLYQYLTHRLHEFHFCLKPIFEPIPLYFMPSGWDSNILLEEFVSMTSVENFNLPYETIITKPIQTSLINQLKPKEILQDILSIDNFLEKLYNENSSNSKRNEDISKEKRSNFLKPNLFKKNETDIIEETDDPKYKSSSSFDLKNGAKKPSKPSESIKTDGESVPNFFKSLQNKYKETHKNISDKARRERPVVIKDVNNEKLDKREES